MKYLKSERGELTFGGIVVLVIVVAAGYVGVKMAVPKIKNFQTKEVFRNEVGRVKTTQEAELRIAVFNKLKEIGVTLKPDPESEDGLIIRNEEGELAVIEATIVMDVNFITGHKYTYVFHPKAIAKK